MKKEVTFRHPDYAEGKATKIKGFKLDGNMFCDMCGAKLTKTEAKNASVITVTKEPTKTERDAGIYATSCFTIRYLCFNCIEKITGRRPDNA